MPYLVNANDKSKYSDTAEANSVFCETTDNQDSRGDSFLQAICYRHRIFTMHGLDEVCVLISGLADT
jgi:hypothetical protein